MANVNNFVHPINAVALFAAFMGGCTTFRESDSSRSAPPPIEYQQKNQSEVRDQPLLDEDDLNDDQSDDEKKSLESPM